MVKKSIIFLICYISVCSAFGQFVTEDINRSFVALQDKPGRGLVKDRVYQITLIDNEDSAQHSGGGVGIRYPAKDRQWSWLHEYTQNQALVESISFSSGALLFLIFAKGFTASFPI
jgi:hypothetical protein